MAFHIFGRLSGVSPCVGIQLRPVFAGNAAILGSCDVLIATRKLGRSAWRAPPAKTMTLTTSQR